MEGAMGPRNVWKWYFIWHMVEGIDSKNCSVKLWHGVNTAPTYRASVVLANRKSNKNKSGILLTGKWH